MNTFHVLLPNHHSLDHFTTECECDCDTCDGGDYSLREDAACAALQGAAAPHPALNPAVPLRRVDDLHFAPQGSGYTLVRSPQASSAFALLQPAARRLLDAFAQPRLPGEWQDPLAAESIRRLYQGGFLQAATAVAPAVAPALAPPKITQSLQAWLFLTRACNLACAHCFVDKDPHRMDETTGRQAVRRLFHLAQEQHYPRLSLKYAGGEPTLRWALLQNLHTLAQQLAADTGVGLKESLVTNGLALDAARLQYLKDARIHLAISLDGFGAGHDRMRPTKNGAPSFDRVLHNLRLALSLGLHPGLTITLTRLNLPDLPAFTRFALENDLDFNLNFYRPSQPGDPLMPSLQDLTHAILQSFAVIRQNLPARPIFQRLLDRSNFGFAHQHACSAGRHYLSIDTDGRALPCHMLTGGYAPAQPQNLADATPAFADFSAAPVTERSGCQECEWRSFCGGGCPLLAKALHGAAGTPSPYCSVYKALFPELLQLEALRLQRFPA